MKILVTGYSGFIGSNFVERVERDYNEIEIYKFNSKSSLCVIEEYTRDCDFVFHFAATHRPKDESEFDKVNYELTSYILECLKKHDNRCPVLYTSSVQAGNGSKYGYSKINAENAVIGHAKDFGSKTLVYRLTNTFGRGARPNGHSVVATFCHNIQRGLPIVISNRDCVMNFCYIDDVIDSFIRKLDKTDTYTAGEIKTVPDRFTYKVTLGRLADTLYYFKTCGEQGRFPELKDAFEEKLLKTYNSYHC